MDKPSWINQVKEVDVDEAKVLLALGLTIGHDWKYVGSQWASDFPFEYTAGVRALEFDCSPDFATQAFYVALGSED